MIMSNRVAGFKVKSRFLFGPNKLATSIVLLCGLTSAFPAQAQLSSLYPNFLTFKRPGNLSMVLFGGGYISDQAGVTQEGFQLEQTITPYIGIFGRATGYQLFVGHGFSNPLDPKTGPSSRYNFGRFQGGLDFAVYPGSHLFISGGRDGGDSHASVIEGDFNSWLFAHSPHPLNFSFNSIHDYENGVTSTEIDLRAVVLSTERLLVLAGGGGAFFAGGITDGTAGQGGPDVTVFYRPWQLGFATQFGYGSSKQYGQLTMFRQFGWNE